MGVLGDVRGFCVFIDWMVFKSFFNNGGRVFLVVVIIFEGFGFVFLRIIMCVVVKIVYIC